MFGVVLSKTRRDVVPAEFCQVVPGQLYKKRVIPEVTSDMIKYSDIKPQQRLNTICNAVGSDVSIYNVLIIHCSITF
jgi:eukaryotic translation initiation factor 2C